MGYTKKDKPNVNLKGIYPNKSDELLGLNSIDLESNSLGNWNSIVRNNRIFISAVLEQTAFMSENQSLNLAYLVSPFNPYDFWEEQTQINYRFFIEVYGWYDSVGNRGEAGQEGFSYASIGKTIINYHNYINISPANHQHRIAAIVGLGTGFDQSISWAGEGMEGSTGTATQDWMKEKSQELFEFLASHPLMIGASETDIYGSLTHANPIKAHFTEALQVEFDEIVSPRTGIITTSYEGMQAPDFEAVVRIRPVFDRPTNGANGESLTFGQLNTVDESAPIG